MLEAVAMQESSYNNKKKTVIGLGKFKMEIDIKDETKKMKSLMRKVGDKSGIGYS